MPTPILLIELALPEPPTKDAIGDQSWFLRSCASFHDRFVLAFGAPSFEKNESHGKLFTQLGAISGDHYEIELAAVLVERLPASKEGPEYCLAITGTRAIGGLFCVSNVMQVIRYRKGEAYRHAVCQAVATEQFLVDHKDNFSEAPHIEYLPSVVSARYDLAGADAESALSNYLENTVDDFIGGINTMVAAHVASIDTVRLGIINPVYDRGSFPWIYMIIRGEGNRFDAQRIATSLLRTTLVPQPYEDEPWQIFTEYASGEREVDVAMKALRSAESYVQSGAYDFALLLAAIAVELATTRFVHARLQEEGVP